MRSAPMWIANLLFTARLLLQVRKRSQRKFELDLAHIDAGLLNSGSQRSRQYLRCGEVKPIGTMATL